MTLSPLFAAPPIFQVHVISAIVVAVLSPFQFFGFRKGSIVHRSAGYIWLMAMLVVALSSFGIRSSLPLSMAGFSPIHLLSIWALYSIVRIIQLARAHQVSAHRKFAKGLAIGFWVAGAFTFVPPRLMWQIVSG